jgi:amidase
LNWRRPPSGDLTDPTYRQQRASATNGARAAIDRTIAAHRLDAILAPTNGPAWKTDLAKGDDLNNFVGSSAPAAVAGYPAITVPAGYATADLPLGVSFFGGRWKVNRSSFHWRTPSNGACVPQDQCLRDGSRSETARSVLKQRSSPEETYRLVTATRMSTPSPTSPSNAP